MEKKEAILAAPPDHVSRAKGSSPFGSTIFVGLRTVDIFIQYGIIAKGYGALAITKLGGSAIDFSSSPSMVLGLPLWPLAIIGMSAGGAIKQVYCLLVLSEQEMPARLSVIVGLANTFTNSLNALIFSSALFSPTTKMNHLNEVSPVLIAGVALYVLGISAEVIAEIQRSRFKSNPGNKGKPYTEGLFSLARHINYGGYTIMRAGYAIASGGWTWGFVTGSILLYDFATRAVPALDYYCSNKYGTAWIAFKKKTTTKLIPGIY
ncbi:hypothetical protein B0O99DRAFT_530240 [Bisporella sp. PMI_857]|nr:hypothetical protein B0O99DRAFT_530240 [Bisporella sp. PMI_857]